MQPAQTSPGQDPAAIHIAPGSVIPVQLTRTIDAKKVKTGDEVDAKVTQDLKTTNGAVLVPKDTKVIGHVTEAQVRDKEQKESQVGIAFDHAAVKNGADMALPMSIQAIIAPPNSNPNNSNESTGQPQSMPSAGGMSPTGRSAGMGGASTPQAPTSEAGTTNTTAGNDAHQPITGNTQGVVGIPNVTLSTALNAAEGSIVRSEKNNVKLESGTLLLLRVTQ
jgi:hypothetical protein